MAEDAVLDFKFGNDLTQRVIVLDGEVYLSSAYFHQGRKRPTVGDDTDLVTSAALSDGAILSEDRDGATVCFFPIPTLIDLYPKDRKSYEDIRRKILAANQGA